MAETSITPAQRIALWADKLRDMSAMGLHFSKDIYDQQRYRDIQTMAMEMHALASGDSFSQIEPLRDTVYAPPMPLVGASAFVFDGVRVLLIRRADDKKWALPGGGLEVGETPAQGAQREVMEESGVQCRVTKLVGLFDSRHIGWQSRYHVYHCVFACEPVADADEVSPTHALEILDKAWFDADKLPTDLSGGHALFIAEAFRVWRGGEPYFDH